MSNQVPTSEVWGLMAPSTSRTPSEGRAQIYTRCGRPRNQRALAFENGTALIYGPNDPVLEYGNQHPFSDQVLNVDKAIREIKSARDGHEKTGTYREAAFNNFRNVTANTEFATEVTVGALKYMQVPSRHGSIQSTPSVYGINNKSDVSGLDHAGFGLKTGARIGLLREVETSPPGPAPIYNRQVRNKTRRREVNSFRGNQNQQQLEFGPAQPFQNPFHRTQPQNRQDNYQSGTRQRRGYRGSHGPARHTIPQAHYHQTPSPGFGGQQYGPTGYNSGTNGYEEMKYGGGENVSNNVRHYQSTSAGPARIPAAPARWTARSLAPPRMAVSPSSSSLEPFATSSIFGLALGELSSPLSPTRGPPGRQL